MIKKISKDIFEVGQTVWFEPDDRRDKGRYTIITKVGRVYYTTEYWDLKFDKETLHRCEYPHGRLYASEQEAKDYKKAESMFYSLKNEYGLRPTLEQMKAVYKILGLEEKDKDNDKQIDIHEKIKKLPKGWVAMDKNEKWWWYEKEPELVCDFGTTTPYGWRFIGKRNLLSDIAPVSDWTKSLIKVENNNAR